jgi:hypothetical protein
LHELHPGLLRGERLDRAYRVSGGKPDIKTIFQTKQILHL